MLVATAVALVSFKKEDNSSSYLTYYNQQLNSFKSSQSSLLQFINQKKIISQKDAAAIKAQIYQVRMEMKSLDFWLRYLEPTAYKKINGPLPVEWETEVFEKYEAPYKREGAGFTLAALYTEEENILKDSLITLVQASIDATKIFAEDSVKAGLKNYHHFYLCNRLFLLNLAAIYTTGFECPDTARIIPELRQMLVDVGDIYSSYNENFSLTALPNDYLLLYKKLLSFCNTQPDKYSQFDNFTFIKDYVNPLFALNQNLIREYKVASKSVVDYSLNKKATSIFSKDLYTGQSEKGIFLRLKDSGALAELEELGKLLFYDPILSVNNSRSCASCHNPAQYFTDTAAGTSMQLNGKDRLARNTPSLINAGFNHLLMVDGKHISLKNQAKDVITNPLELGANEKVVLQKVLSCTDYKKRFEKLLQYTPLEQEITIEHIISAITIYYSKFNNYYAAFDDAINKNKTIDAAVKDGFNLFMSKAQCATCHFVPQFNGVKPPFVGSEFEVLGVPKDTGFKALSPDKGRYEINPANETLHAFRTGSIRNAAYTKPYMHNGVFTSLEQVINFYDAGGGTGRGLKVDNQTLSPDSLKLTKTEKANLLSFIQSLNENIPFENAPEKLPASKNKILNQRKVGGDY